METTKYYKRIGNCIGISHIPNPIEIGDFIDMIEFPDNQTAALFLNALNNQPEIESLKKSLEISEEISELRRESLAELISDYETVFLKARASSRNEICEHCECPYIHLFNRSCNKCGHFKKQVMLNA